MENLNKKKEIARKATEITLNRVKKYEELDAPTEDERDKIFKQKTLELWNRFAIQGLFNPKLGRIDTFTDLDGRGALGFLKLAGIIDPKNYAIYNRTIEKTPTQSNINLKEVVGQSPNKKKVHKIISYIAAGETLPGAIHLDTGHREGIVSDENASAFFDHHGPESGLDSSATKKVYEGLTALGLIEPDPNLEKISEFITQIDNGTFPEMEKYFMDFHRTVLGLERFAQFDQLVKFFRDGHRPTDLLSPTELKKYGLEKGSDQQKRKEELSKMEFEQLQKDGFIINTKTGGRALIALNSVFSGGYLGAKYFGANIYIIWSPDRKNFFISNNDENIKLNLSQGKNIRGKMWIKPIHDKSPMEITLKEVLNQITYPNFSAQGKLSEYLESENR